jgi:hypothetical protein
MHRSILLAALAIGFSPLTLAQSDIKSDIKSDIDCRAIAAATVAELRAGHEAWSDAAEQLARAAAGAACVKATSTSRSVTRTEGLSSTAVTADDVQPADYANMPAEGSGGEIAAKGVGSDDEKADKGAGGGDDGDSSWNPFSDIKFNKVSARPNKKPYERRRESVDEE